MGYQYCEVVVMTWGMEGLPLLSQAQATVFVKVLWLQVIETNLK